VEAGDPAGAEASYTAALALAPPRGADVLYSNRSAARLAQEGRAAAALEDAVAARDLAPQWFRAYSRMVGQCRSNPTGPRLDRAWCQRVKLKYDLKAEI
jgi:ABC-type amino acid transport substrate-binding protein